MEKLFTPDELKKYFNGGKRHRAYQETVDQYDPLRIHANGEYPKKLIDERRPGESDEIKEYRKKTYEPVTKGPITKVINSLAKIRRSPDWSVSYKDSETPPAVRQEETLQQYCETKYPGFGSVTNWVFSVMLKNQCIDPNAIIAVFPTKGDIKENEYYKPMAMIFNSCDVLYYEEDDDWAILKASEKSDVKKGDNAYDFQAGDVFYVFTTERIFRYDQSSKDREFVLTWEIRHGLGFMPLFKMPAQFLKQKDNTAINESRISPMIPELNEAAREYSDLQAGKVQHMYPFLWYLDNKECNHCGGTGKVVNMNDPQSGSKNCTHCQGKGKVKFSPYSMMAIDPPKLGQGAIPTPPAGYIARDTEIIKLQDESVEKHKFKALATINMQFLDQTPLNISGDAKNVDREELNNFVYSVAEDIVFAMDKIYFFINEWRYSYLIKDQKAREAMLPKIPVPQNFDLLPSDYLVKQISDMKTAKVNPILIAAAERDYAVKAFYTNPQLAAMIDLFYELDPLPCLNADEKMTILSNKGCSLIDYVISCNLATFLQIAVQEDGDFAKKKYPEKIEILTKMAKDKIEVIERVAEVKQEVKPAEEEEEPPVE